MVGYKSEKILALACLLALASQAAAENDPISEPECDDGKTVSIRYSATSARLYLEAAIDGERGGCVTLSQIFTARGGKAPLYAIDPDTDERSTTETGTWLLTESLYVEDGITLNVHGGDEGNADELRLQSSDDGFINLRGHGGSLSFHSTKVFAWDEDTKEVHDPSDYEEGRSYISVISEILQDGQTCDGKAKSEMGEARMDIVSSDMGYLGYKGSEAYGLTWKVRGFCKDKSNPEIFDDVNVYGNIYDSDIHHNYFGVYTYGHQQGDWRRNKMRENIQYGFDPHDDSDYLNIHDNEVYGNGNHGIIASKRCNDVSIQGNTVYDGGQAGLFLHRSSDDAIVKGNNVYNNADAGLAMLESFGAVVSENTFTGNKYGVRMSVGCANNEITDNKITDSTKYNAYTYKGSDAPDVVDSGYSNTNTYSSNTITGGLETIKLKESVGMVFTDNTFVDATTIRFDDSTEVLMAGNTGLDSVTLKVANDACFASGSDAEFVPTC